MNIFIIEAFDRLVSRIRKKYCTKKVPFNQLMPMIRKDCEWIISHNLYDNKISSKTANTLLELLEIDATATSITLKVGDIQTILNF